jgi:flavin reductase (DIM6/NTAB) family NADH-FMN oxidoreductase RutF
MEHRVIMGFRRQDGSWIAPVAPIGMGVERPNILALGVMGTPCDDPPTVTISPRPHRYSYRLIQETASL